MRFFQALVLSVFSLFSHLAEAQEKKGADAFESWITVPSNEAGLVIIIDAKIDLFVLSDEKGEKLDASKWTPSVPFIRQYRISPGIYQIRLPGPLDAVSINVEDGRLLYLQLSSYLDGLRVSVWTNAATMQFKNLVLGSAAKIPEILDVQRIDSASKVFHISTDPPWLPPPPPKR